VALVLGFGIGTMPAMAQSPDAPASKALRIQRMHELREKAARIRNELEALESPDGVTRSNVPRTELTDQPTRNMRESLESLPGVITRQGNDPRDLNISIRGSSR
jgi:iron complex outermembrane receptor protein